MKKYIVRIPICPTVPKKKKKSNYEWIKIFNRLEKKKNNTV